MVNLMADTLGFKVAKLHDDRIEVIMATVELSIPA